MLATVSKHNGSYNHGMLNQSKLSRLLLCSLYKPDPVSLESRTVLLVKVIVLGIMNEHFVPSSVHWISNVEFQR